MANVFEWDEAGKDEWDEWLAPRPQVIKDLAVRLPPNKLYRLKTTEHRVTIYSYEENGTVTVTVSGTYNLIQFARNVFGINPDDLEECDLPDPDETLGEVLTDREDIDRYLATLRNDT